MWIGKRGLLLKRNFLADALNRSTLEKEIGKSFEYNLLQPHLKSLSQSLFFLDLTPEYLTHCSKNWLDFPAFF